MGDVGFGVGGRCVAGCGRGLGWRDFRSWKKGDGGVGSRVEGGFEVDCSFVWDGSRLLCSFRFRNKRFDRLYGFQRYGMVWAWAVLQETVS